MANVYYTVVENAGYVGERDVQSHFKNIYEAWRWVDFRYTADEKEDLHVDVRRDPEGTYDF